MKKISFSTDKNSLDIILACQFLLNLFKRPLIHLTLIVTHQVILCCKRFIVLFKNVFFLFLICLFVLLIYNLHQKKFTNFKYITKWILTKVRSCIATATITYGNFDGPTTVPSGPHAVDYFWPTPLPWQPLICFLSL